MGVKKILVVRTCNNTLNKKANEKKPKSQTQTILWIWNLDTHTFRDMFLGVQSHLFEFQYSCVYERDKKNS